MERAHMSCYSYGHAINYLKAGITAADRLLTVSSPAHHALHTLIP
jgi:glycogen synthase